MMHRSHFCSDWCILGFETGTLWDLWDLCVTRYPERFAQWVNGQHNFEQSKLDPINQLHIKRFC